MQREQIEARIREVMSGLFGVDAERINPDASMQTIDKWDSLQHVTFVMSLEQAFGLRFEMDDAFQMTSFAAVCRTVEKYLAGG